MIPKKVTQQDLSDSADPKQDLAYWLSKTPEERLSAVEILRRQYYGDSSRLQRIITVIERSPR